MRLDNVLLELGIISGFSLFGCVTLDGVTCLTCVNHFTVLALYFCRAKRARSQGQEDIGISHCSSMEKISVLAAAALQSQHATLSPEPSRPTEPSAATRRSLRTSSNMSSSSAGRYSADHFDSPSAADSGSGRIKGKMTQYERYVHPHGSVRGSPCAPFSPIAETS